MQAPEAQQLEAIITAIEGKVDSKRLSMAVKTVQRFLDNGQRPTILIACHPDADGLVSGAIMLRMLQQKHGKNAELRFDFNSLNSQEFYRAARRTDQVVALDLWCGDTGDDQLNVATLFNQGRDVLILDHHDAKLKLTDGQKNYNPADPRTIPYLPQKDTSQQAFGFISPKTLNAQMNSASFTSATVTLLLAHKLGVEIPTANRLLQLSLKGDNATKAWESETGPVDEKIIQISNLLNLAINLTDEHKKILIRHLASGEPISHLLETEEFTALKKLQTWLQTKTTELVEKFEAQANPDDTFHYHISKEETDDAKNGHRERSLIENPELKCELATMLTRRIGQHVDIIVTQEVDGEIHMSARSEREGEEHNMGTILDALGGGGHPKAAAAKLKPHRDEPLAEAATQAVKTIRSIKTDMEQQSRELADHRGQTRADVQDVLGV